MVSYLHRKSLVINGLVIQEHIELKYLFKKIVNPLKTHHQNNQIIFFDVGLQVKKMVTYKSAYPDQYQNCKIVFFVL